MHLVPNTMLSYTYRKLKKEETVIHFLQSLKRGITRNWGSARVHTSLAENRLESSQIRQSEMTLMWDVMALGQHLGRAGRCG